MMQNSWPWPSIVAHCGGGVLAPENTLAAIDKGAAGGHKMIEFDARRSLDGEIFLLHDDTLDRTSNGWGVAEELPWEKLALLDAGSWFSRNDENERLPHLAERCRGYQMMANIELKPASGLEQVTGRAVALAAKTLWQGMTAPLLSSFAFQSLIAAREVVPELPRGWLLHEWTEQWQQQASALECISLHFNHKVLTRERVAAVKGAGYGILSYTVNKPERARILLSWGVDAICTDRLDLIGPGFN